MPIGSIVVRENTRAVRRFRLTNRDIGLVANPGDAVDITSYAFKLTVKNDIDDVDANALINKAATIIDALDGVFEFSLSPSETALAPDIYRAAEVRWWDDGNEVKPPSDAQRISYTIQAAVDKEV